MSASASDTKASAAPVKNTTPRSRVILASLVGTTIEFYDFYIYATAAVAVFPVLFFPSKDATTELLASFATFGVAFIARPLGSVIFGHFGDKIGRKATLVGALLTMGLATFIIGLLPTYHQIGLWAPTMLTIMRFCRAWAWAANGPVRRCLPANTLRKVSVHAPRCGLSWCTHRLRACERLHAVADQLDYLQLRNRREEPRAPLPHLGLAYSVPAVHRDGRRWSVRAFQAGGDPPSSPRLPLTMRR